MDRIVGIDLGTSTSEIACIQDGAPLLIPNHKGKFITPSVVHIPESGEPLVGEDAAEYLYTRPDCTFMEVKRLTGSGQTLTAHGKPYTPEAIQAILLRYLAGCAKDFLGEPVRRAVITVPAYFTDVQRRATAQAGELAGLQVERILNEPTAASMDYGLANLSQCKNILVYDLGGGTLDVTVLELFEGVIDVRASCGNNQLGGKDFDEILMAKLSEDLSAVDERAKMRLKQAAEACKIALSTEERHDVSLPFLAAGVGGRPLSVERTVTRSELEEWIQPKVDATRAPLLTALSDAGLIPADIDITLLVGGSTRIPCVRKLVAGALSCLPQSLVDPDLAVVRGAAIQGGILDGSLEGDPLVLTDVCPYTLGVAVLRDGVFGKRLVCDPIIPRNTTIPAERTEIYSTAHDYQTEVEIKAYQGDATDPEDNEYLGEVRLTGIPPARQGKETVEVAFAYDLNGILQVTARSVSTRREVSASISTAGVESQPPLDLSGWEEVWGAKKHRPLLRKAEKKIAAGLDEDGELALLVRQIKEALVLGKRDRAEDLREELFTLLEMLEEEE